MAIDDLQDLQTDTLPNFTFQTSKASGTCKGSPVLKSVINPIPYRDLDKDKPCFIQSVDLQKEED